MSRPPEARLARRASGTFEVKGTHVLNFEARKKETR
jgi:hypothetical protein